MFSLSSAPVGALSPSSSLCSGVHLCGGQVFLWPALIPTLALPRFGALCVTGIASGPYAPSGPLPPDLSSLRLISVLSLAL